MYSMSYNWKSPEKSKSDILRSISNSIAKRVGRFRSSSLNTNNSISEVPVFHQQLIAGFDLYHVSEIKPCV